MEGRQNNAEPEIQIMTDNSPLRDTFNTPSFPAIPDYNCSEQDADGRDTLETNLNVTALLLS